MLRWSTNKVALCGSTFIIPLRNHSKHADIDCGYLCSLDLPEALLHVWFFCQYCGLACGLKHAGLLRTHSHFYDSVFQHIKV